MHRNFSSSESKRHVAWPAEGKIVGRRLTPVCMCVLTLFLSLSPFLLLIAGRHNVHVSLSRSASVLSLYGAALYLYTTNSGRSAEDSLPVVAWPYKV